MVDPSGTWLDQALGSPGPPGDPGNGFIDLPGGGLGLSQTEVVAGYGTTGPTRGNSRAGQTTAGTPTITLVTIPIPPGTSSDLFLQVLAKGAAGTTWRDTFDALISRNGSSAPVVELVPAEPARKGGLLAGCSGVVSVSGNNAVLAVTGPASDVDWRVWWSSNDLTPSAVPLTAPAITSVSPTHGPLAGGTAFTLDGVRFTGTNPTNGVKVNGVNCTSIVVVSDIQITGVTPAGASSGATTLTVNNGLGTDSVSFTYDSAGFAWTLPSTGTLVGFWDAVDASKVTTAIANQASQVDDISGGTLHQTQPTSGNQPGYGASYQINGHNALGQRGASKMSTAAIGALSDHTVAFVPGPTDVSGDNTYVTFGAFNPEVGVKDGVCHVYLGAYYVGSTAIANGSRPVIVVKRSGTTLTMYVNGTQQTINGGGTSASISGAATGTTIQLMFDGSVTFAKGNLACLGVWSSALNDSDRNAIETQMQARVA